MNRRCHAVMLVLVSIPAVATAQTASPVASAFRADEADRAKILIAAAETMPADKYGFKPTPAQMTYGAVVMHLVQGNDYLCGTLGGRKAPQREKLAATDSKEALVAQLKESFKFCDDALAGLDDSKLAEELPFFGGKTRSRAAIMTLTTGDWADHYSQMSIYLRMNGELPPTAKKPA